MIPLHTKMNRGTSLCVILKRKVKRARILVNRYPLLRGMLSYGIIWPLCSFTQEYIENKTPPWKADWVRATRFCFFGAFFMAPVFYTWMKYSNRFFKRKNFLTAVKRAVIEQMSYGPMAMAYFFFGMSVLEGKSFSCCINEVREKFLPTYKRGLLFWPMAQSINFYFVPERNRMIFVSGASYIWTVFMAHMKSKEQKYRVLYNVQDWMLSYGIIWPLSSVTQEYLEFGTTLKNADWLRALRFSIFGSFFMAPIFYTWLRYSNRFFKSPTLSTAIKRAIIEQISYGPLALAFFFFGISALELKPLSVCVNEAKEKFPPTYKRSVVYWPTVQTLNFYFIPHRNRVVFASAASFVWTVYLAHVKAKSVHDSKEICYSSQLIMAVDNKEKKE